jgi:O-acetylserine/cysteine efflux transporter
MQKLHMVLAVFIALVWGVNFVAAKAAMLHFSPFFFLGMRLLVIAVLLSPFLRYKPFSFWQMLKVSFTLTVLHFGLMFTSLQMGMSVSVAVVVDQLRVPFALILGYFLFGETLAKRGLVGVAVAILGTFVIMGAPSVVTNVESFWILLAATISWAFYNIQVKQMEEMNVFSFLGWASILGAPQLLAVSWLFEQDQWQQVQTATAMTWVSAAYVTLVATLVAHGCWYFLVKRYDINQVVPYTLLSPFFGMVAGILLLQEMISWETMVGGILTVSGVAMVVCYRIPFLNYSNRH